MIRISTLCVILLTQYSASATSVSGVISKDIRFFHEPFPVPPSKRAIIGIDLVYSDTGLSIQPSIGIYTTCDHVNIRKRCRQSSIGQLANRELHRHVELGRYKHRSLHCTKVSGDLMHCAKKITLQDFIPRTYSLFPWICL